MYINQKAFTIKKGFYLKKDILVFVMAIYKIADSKVVVNSNESSKVEKFFREFKYSRCIEKETMDICNIQIKNIYADDEMEKIKNEYSIFLESTDCFTSYGIKYRIVPGAWRHLIFRENPLTEGFLVSNQNWDHLVIVDDCRQQKRKKEDKWKKLLFGQGRTLDEESEWIELCLTGFYSYATLHNTMMIHASAVKYQDKAVLFTAPSGTGKTTQAELWKKIVGADILNGDRVFITYVCNEDKLYAWGSPWAGSSPYIVNDCAEIVGIIVLEQADENFLQKMSVEESMMQLSSNSFLPMWDVECLKGMLDVMNRVLKNVPVYKLACRPDEAAVKVVLREIFG